LLSPNLDEGREQADKHKERGSNDEVVGASSRRKQWKMMHTPSNEYPLLVYGMHQETNRNALDNIFTHPFLFGLTDRIHELLLAFPHHQEKEG
jgi:hypothetical protein